MLIFFKLLANKIKIDPFDPEIMFVNIAAINLKCYFVY